MMKRRRRTLVLLVALLALALPGLSSATDQEESVTGAELRRALVAVDREYRAEISKPPDRQTVSTYDRLLKRLDDIDAATQRGAGAGSVDSADVAPLNIESNRLKFAIADSIENARQSQRVRAEAERQRAAMEARSRDIEARGVAWPKEILAAVLRGEVVIGMTAEQVMLARGRPEHINETVTALGRSEQWVYALGDYVYLSNGVVTMLQRIR